MVLGKDVPASAMRRLSKMIRQADPRGYITEPALSSARNSGDVEELIRLAEELRALAMPAPIFETKRQLVDMCDPLSYAASRWDGGAWSTLQPIVEEVNLIPKIHNILIMVNRLLLNDKFIHFSFKSL